MKRLLSHAKLFTAGLVASACLSGVAHAGVIFEDTFDNEFPSGASQLDYNGFTQWSVSDGTVDLVANTNPWGIDCVGNTGKCVDLDGSSSNAGIFTSSTIALNPGDYVLSFDISGNQRGGASDDLVVTLGGFFNDTFTLAPSDPWTTITHSFTVSSLTSNAFIFNHAGGDNIGIMLDNVKLVQAVPEPGTLGLMGLGLIGLGFARRRAR